MASKSVAQVTREREERKEQQVRDEKKHILELLKEAASELRAALDERPDLPEVLSAKQVAKLLNFNKKTFYSRYHERRIPGCLGVKPARFSKNVILKWIRNGRRPVAGSR